MTAPSDPASNSDSSSSSPVTPPKQKVQLSTPEHDPVYYDASSGEVWIDAWRGTSVDDVTVFQSSDRADVTRTVKVAKAHLASGSGSVTAVIVYNLTSSMMPDSARVEGTGAATVLEVVEVTQRRHRRSSGVASIRGRRRGCCSTPRGTMNDACTGSEADGTHVGDDDFGAVGGGGGGKPVHDDNVRNGKGRSSGDRPDDGGGGGGGVRGRVGAIASELDALASSGWNSLETLMTRRREALTRLDEESDVARASTLAAQEAYNAAAAAAAGRIRGKRGGDVKFDQLGGGGGRRQIRVVLETQTSDANANANAGTNAAVTPD